MDNIAVMAPSTPLVNNELLSDESESESISLDLHVSDTDEVAEIVKTDHLESEEDILNKFVDEDKTIKTTKTKVNGMISPVREEKVTMAGGEDKMRKWEESMEEPKLNVNESELMIKKAQDKPEGTLVNGKPPTPVVNEELGIKDQIKENQIDENTDDITEENKQDKVDENLEDKMKENKVDQIEGNKQDKLVNKDDKMEENRELQQEENSEYIMEDNKVDKIEENKEDKIEESKENKIEENKEVKMVVDEEDKIEENKEDTIEENKDDKIEDGEDKIEENKEDKKDENKDDKMEENREDRMEENKEDKMEENKEDKMEENKNNKMKDNMEEDKYHKIEEILQNKIEEHTEDRKEKTVPDETKNKCDSDDKLSGVTNECEKEEIRRDDDEEEDLLQVMETTFDEDHKDENSCSSLSEKENDENKEEIEDNQEEIEDLPAEIEETNLEDQYNGESMQIDEECNQENEDSCQESEETNQETEEDAMQDGGTAFQDDITEESTEIMQENITDEIPKKNGDMENEESKITELKNKDTGDELTKDETADDDMNDCPMDIEENDIGGVIITEKSLKIEKAMEVDVDANKENENVAETQALSAQDKAQKTKSPSISGDDVVTLIDDDVTDDTDLKDEPKKPIKRKQPDHIDEESHKKLKLDPRNEVKEKRQIEALKSFKEFMQEKKLKVLTRLELEEFCLQKMCEWIIDKSELAELRQKVKVLEQTLDNWRKEAVTVAKQTRDLKIVHDRVIADLKLMKEQTGKPLVPVKITRSVGLQAVMDNNIRRPPLPNGVVPNARVTPNNTNAVVSNVRNTVSNTKTPVRQHVTPVTNTQNKPSPQRMQSGPVSKPLQPIATKDNSRGSSALIGATAAKVGNQQPTAAGTATPRKSTETQKGVIDLTDDEDKTTTCPAVPSVTLTPSNRGRVNGQSPLKTTTVATTNGPTKHVMLMPTSMLTTRPVMLKVNSNLVSSSNSQVSIVTTQSKTGQQVRVPVTSITSVRQMTSPKFKHPAPLPLPPPSQHHITGRKPLPPKPILNLTRSACGTGIVLQWKMPYQLEQYEAIISYQLYAYQETKTPPRTDNWGKIGDVKALELPMAVTLTQFAVGNRYFFAVRAVDSHKRLGPFSDPQTILL